LDNLTLSNSSKVDDYGLVFTLPTFDHIEMIPDGADKLVTLENA